MTCYEKDGVQMVVSESMAKIFESCGYEKVEDSAAAPLSPEIRNAEPMQACNLEDSQNKEPEQKKYTRSEIARMSTADLKEVAKSLGLEVTEESTGKMLKEQIIEKLGL